MPVNKPEQIVTENLPPAIIFDLDDTILSDDKALEMCWRQVCNDQAQRIVVCSTDELLADIRAIHRWFLTDPSKNRQFGIDPRRAPYEILSMAFDRHSIVDEDLKEEMSDAYHELKLVTIELIPGALDTLRSLRECGTALGLITNGDAAVQRAKVRKAGLEPLFDFVLVAGEFGSAKPDPRVFQHTLEQLQASPEQAWMVGDNLVNDVGGAQALGIFGVWVDWLGGGLPESSQIKPDRIVRSISELVS